MTIEATVLVPVDMIAKRITVIRNQRVILDSDLAKLYGVSTKVFNQAVKRNQGRFDADFMFQLTAEEYATLRSQIVTLKEGKTPVDTGRRKGEICPNVRSPHRCCIAW